MQIDFADPNINNKKYSYKGLLAIIVIAEMQMQNRQFLNWSYLTLLSIDNDVDSIIVYSKQPIASPKK